MDDLLDPTCQFIGGLAHRAVKALLRQFAGFVPDNATRDHIRDS
jgi:hypothetical protein